MGNSTNNTPRTVKLNIALAIAVVAFLVGAGIGVAVWIAISGGSGEASVSAEQRAPQLSLSDATEEATSVPPTMAIRELTATRPLILSTLCADITLKPNQPTVRIHAPSARNGILEGGCAVIAPSLR